MASTRRVPKIGAGKTGMISTRPSTGRQRTPVGGTSKSRPARHRQTSMYEFGQLDPEGSKRIPRSRRGRKPLGSRTNTNEDPDGHPSVESRAQCLGGPPDSPHTPPRPNRDYAEIMRALSWHCTLRTPDGRMACDDRTGALPSSMPRPCGSPFVSSPVNSLHSTRARSFRARSPHFSTSRFNQLLAASSQRLLAPIATEILHACARCNSPRPDLIDCHRTPDTDRDSPDLVGCDRCSA